jgi:DNA-binding transcriptional MerR regulator
MALGLLYQIDDVVEATGLSESVLRIWESRYGWPRPPRHPGNGYRLYSQAMVDDLKRMAELLKSGLKPSDLIRSGMPCWPDLRASDRPTWHRLDALPRPRTEDALRFRDRLILLVKQRHSPRIAEAMHCSVFLHGQDRLAACWLPAYFGHRLWLSVRRPLEVRGFDLLFLRLAGEPIVRLVHLRWEAADN